VALAERSASLDPPFAQAVEQAMALLDQAIRLDPENGDAYVERGYLKAYFDLAAADADFRRGIELSPNYARGYEGLAAVMFQTIARRREALDLIEKARRLDPLAPHLEVIKATYLFYGAADAAQAASILETVLEREPLYVPAIVRLAEIRWTSQGAFAESVQLGEQAIALDPGNEAAWRELVSAYLEMDESDAASDAAQHAWQNPDIGAMAMHVHRGEWRDAGEAAYRVIAAGRTTPQTEVYVALAIVRHAHATGQFDRAIPALESWAQVDWDGDEPVLGGDLDLGYAVTGLAELLAVRGQSARATALLEAFLADASTQINRYGRGAAWLNGARATALALLGRHDEAIAVLKEQERLGFGKHRWRIALEQQTAFDPLKPRKDYQDILVAARANASRERDQLRKMRADGLVPSRP
jgi:tetratricopeptide (TPR) repeat protein